MNKVYKLITEKKIVNEAIKKQESKLHKTIKEVTDNIQNFKHYLDSFPNSSYSSVPVMFPNRESVAVKFAPLDMIERLEEYQNDENFALFLLGLFIGAIIGIISNWATDKDILITKFSIILISIFLFLSVGCIIWLLITRARKTKSRKKIKKYYSGQ